MFNFFKSKKKTERLLQSAFDLKKGDMFTLVDSFAYPDWLKGQSLKITEVNTYQYGHSEAEYEMVLETPSGQPAFMTLENEDGEQWLNLCIKIQRDDVDSIFTLDEFARIFDEEGLTKITVAQKPEPFSRFLADSYQQKEAPYLGYYHRHDLRGQSLPYFEQDGDNSCEVIELISDDELFSLNIEIWQGGETDVSLSITRPLSDIIDLFPGSN